MSAGETEARAEYKLHPHPDTPGGAVEYVRVSLEQSAHGLDLAYVIGCATDRLVVPPPSSPNRRDGLWRTTCLELFAADQTGGYAEFNFSPSTEWAAYRFSAYRTGMAEAPLAFAPRIVTRDAGDALIVIARIVPPFPYATMAGLSVVVEETDGTRSFWALAHGDGPPDFHNAEGFTASLPAPARPA